MVHINETYYYCKDQYNNQEICDDFGVLNCPIGFYREDRACNIEQVDYESVDAQ